MIFRFDKLEDCKQLPIKRGEKFKLELKVEAVKMVITINGIHYRDVAHGETLSGSSPSNSVADTKADTLLKIEGDISIDRITLQ